MAGYAVSVRIDRVQPRLAQHEGHDLAGHDRSTDERPPEQIDLGQPTWGRWERIRESWTQMTFYLFDAESWR